MEKKISRVVVEGKNSVSELIISGIPPESVLSGIPPGSVLSATVLAL